MQLIVSITLSLILLVHNNHVTQWSHIGLNQIWVNFGAMRSNDLTKYRLKKIFLLSYVNFARTVLPDNVNIIYLGTAIAPEQSCLVIRQSLGAMTKLLTCLSVKKTHLPLWNSWMQRMVTLYNTGLKYENTENTSLIKQLRHTHKYENKMLLEMEAFN